MGNKPNTIGSSSVRKQQHSRLGLIQIVKNQEYDGNSEQQNAELIATQQYVLSNSELTEWKQKLLNYTQTNLCSNKDVKKQKTNHHSPNNQQHYKLSPLTLTEQIKDIMFLPISCQIKKEGYCGGLYHLEILYPNYSIVLRQEIKNRWEVQKFYSEPEIWYLLYNLIILERYFEPMSRKIGNVHPKNILMNQSNGVMKIITVLSLPKQRQNFEIICQSQLEDVFISPEQIDKDYLKRCIYPENINKNLAEIFTIGITVLQAGTLHLSTNIYDRGPYRINNDKLKQNIGMFRLRYGPHLSNIVEGMLAVNPKSRRTSQEVYEILKPYENDILNLEPIAQKMFKNNSNRIQNQYSFTSSKSNSIMNNSSVQSSQIKPGRLNMNLEMYQSKVLAQKPSTTNYRKKAQQIPKYLPIKFEQSSDSHNLFQKPQSKHQFTEQRMQRSEKIEHIRFYSPRVIKTTYTN